jgi:hypothetical protein
MPSELHVGAPSEVKIEYVRLSLSRREFGTL